MRFDEILKNNVGWFWEIVKKKMDLNTIETTNIQKKTKRRTYTRLWRTDSKREKEKIEITKNPSGFKFTFTSIPD